MRRTFVGVAFGGMAYWQINGGVPDAQGENAWRGLLWVIVLVLLGSIFLRLRKMSKRWQR